MLALARTAQRRVAVEAAPRRVVVGALHVRHVRSAEVGGQAVSAPRGVAAVAQKRLDGGLPSLRRRTTANAVATAAAAAAATTTAAAASSPASRAEELSTAPLALVVVAVVVLGPAVLAVAHEGRPVREAQRQVQPRVHRALDAPLVAAASRALWRPLGGTPPLRGQRRRRRLLLGRLRGLGGSGWLGARAGGKAAAAAAAAASGAVVGCSVALALVCRRLDLRLSGLCCLWLRLFTDGIPVIVELAGQFKLA